MPLEIATLGYVGFDNLGDEAILAGIAGALRSREIFGNASITALTASPERTRILHPGLAPRPRGSLRSLASRLKGTDLFILGGGSLFQDATSIRSVAWYALAARIARTRARRVLWWGHGIGPLRSRWSRRMVATVARNADAITVRDPASAELLKVCGHQGSIEVVPDPAYLLDPPTPAALREGTVVAWRAWGDRTGPPAGAGFVGPVRGIAMHPGDESSLPAGDRLDWMAWNDPLTKVVSSLAGARMVVAVRLHALVFSVVARTPFVAVSYDPKVTALAKATGQGDVCVPIEDCDADALRRAIENVEATWDARHAHLDRVAREFREGAARPARIAEEWFA